MAIFISYSRVDEEQAERVAASLRASGYEVWRDDELPAHRAYSEVIEERLKSAEAVVVLWSEPAAKSQWVRAEADAARNGGTLIQATLDGTTPPIPFNQIQCADLSNWIGQSDSGWRKLLSSVEALAGAPQPAVEEPKARAGKTAVCVLPFQNMSGDPEQEYFSDGISEDITTDLSKVSALAVTARNTAFQFKGKSVDVSAIAQKIGVSHVLEGSVRKAGERVRITAQLIDGVTGDHVWAERYDRELTDIFAIQDEISKAIVEALKVKLLPAERIAIVDRGTANVAAYDLYLMARQTWISGIHGDTRREKTVLRLCDKVIDMEPGYGKAWGLKALAEATLFFGYNQGSSDGVATADRAIQLDPSVIEAYCAKARASADRRNFADAEAQIENALRIDRNSWDANRGAAQIATWQRKLDQAARYFEKCAQLEPEHLYTWEMLTMVYRGLDDRDQLLRSANELLKYASKAVVAEPGNSSALGRGASALVILGNIAQAKEWIERALLIDPDNLDIRYNFACSLINESADANLIFEYLDYVFARSVGSIVRRADLDADLDPIRDHPHFREIYAAAMERLAKLDAEQAASDASSIAAASARPRS